jgi:hypothetical protein
MTVGCFAANGRTIKIKRPRLKIEPGAPGKYLRLTAKALTELRGILTLATWK